jgi:hypothetical protein
MSTGQGTLARIVSTSAFSMVRGINRVPQMLVVVRDTTPQEDGS